MTESKPAGARNQTLELLRIAAAFGIVVFHAKAPGAGIGYAGLVVFAALSIHFDALVWPARRGIGSLALRLLVPFSFWSVAYGLKNLVLTHKVFPEGSPPVFDLVAGPAGHLWFLPFIFAALAIENTLKPFVNRLTFLAIASFLALAMIASAPVWRPIELPSPLPQWLHCAPAVFLGAAIGAGWTNQRWLASSVALLGAGIALALEMPGISDAYPAGLALLLGALWLPSLPLNVEPVSRCMLGVYLVHIAALGVAGTLMPVDNLAVAAAVFMACLAGVYLARRLFPSTRWILG